MSIDVYFVEITSLILIALLISVTLKFFTNDFKDNMYWILIFDDCIVQ